MDDHEFFARIQEQNLLRQYDLPETLPAPAEACQRHPTQGTDSSP